MKNKQIFEEINRTWISFQSIWKGVQDWMTEKKLVADGFTFTRYKLA